MFRFLSVPGAVTILAPTALIPRPWAPTVVFRGLLRFMSMPRANLTIEWQS